MKMLKLWFAITLLSGATLALAGPPGQVGRISYLTGTVSFAAADARNDWGVAPLNRPVTSGDRLWADRDGRAEVRVGPTAIRMGALTSVDVLRLDDDGTQLRLAQGTLNVNLRQLDPGDSFEIGTPGGAVLLTQPGSYRVTVDPSGNATTVLVRRGQADVLTGSTPVLLRDSQYASFTAQGQELAPAPAADEFDNWAFARDRLEERVVATRYVPPAMTGYEELDQHGAWHSATDYGNVWIPAAMPVGWAPYRHGRWLWVSPWGWTWVDNAPWGFAPYHYGRWVWWGNRWAWAPGARVARPVYAPALVAFVGGANWSAAVSSGPAVAWVPLGWREPYIPWYRHSPTYVRNVNITHVTNVNVINQYTNVRNVTHIRYVNRDVPSGTTVVTRDTFVRARPVHDAHLNVPAHALAAARVTHQAPVARPERQSLMVAQSHARVPAAVEAREVMAAREPVASPRIQGNNLKGGERNAIHDERPRVRVLPAQAIAAPRRTPESVPAAAGERERAADVAREGREARGERPSERRERAAEPQPVLQPGLARRAEPATALVPPTPATERRERTAEPANAQLKPRQEAPAAPPVAAPPGEARQRVTEPVPVRRAEPPPAQALQQQQQEQSARAVQQGQQRQAREQAQHQQQEQQARAAQQEQQRRAQEQAQRQQQEQQARAAQQEQQRRAHEQAQRQQQEQQARAAQQEQQRRAREHAQQLQQQREQHQQELQQRAQQVQQQRERQYQQAQAVEQQRQAQRQERRQAQAQQGAEQAQQPQKRRPPPEAERGAQQR